MIPPCVFSGLVRNLLGVGDPNALKIWISHRLASRVGEDVSELLLVVSVQIRIPINLKYFHCSFVLCVVAKELRQSATDIVPLRGKVIGHPQCLVPQVPGFARVHRAELIVWMSLAPFLVRIVTPVVKYLLILLRVKRPLQTEILS